MKDFNYYAPTEVAFGKESEQQVAGLVEKYGGTKVLVHYIKELIGRDITDAEISEMVRKCSHDHTATCGCLKVLTSADMEAVYKMARG